MTVNGFASRRLDQLMGFSGLLSAAGFAAMGLVVAADICLRNFGLVKWPWLGEVTEYLLTFSTFAGAPWVLRQAGHVNVDILLRILTPAASQGLVRLADLVGLVVASVMLWLSVATVLDSYATGALVFKNLVFPEWYLLLPALWCFAACSLEFAHRLLGRRVSQ